MASWSGRRIDAQMQIQTRMHKRPRYRWAAVQAPSGSMAPKGRVVGLY
jgi:hypothetical protein